MGQEKRQHHRVTLRATALLTDTYKICEGDIVDVSIGGMAIERVPNKMLKTLPKEITAVVLFGESNAKVMMVPKWYQADTTGVYSTVGFKITGLFDAWHTFMRHATLPGASQSQHNNSLISRHTCLVENRI